MGVRFRIILFWPHPLHHYWGASLIAAIAVFAHLRIASARLPAFSADLIVFTWLGVQLAIIGYVSWMQPTTAIVALVILAIASLLPKGKPSHMAYTGSHKD